MMLAAVSPLVSSLGAPLVPQIADLFEVSLSAAQWTLTGPLLFGAVSAPLIGRIGEGPARRGIIIAVLVVVLAGTILATVPLGFGAFLVGRIAQGAGFGLLPMAMAIARDVLPWDRRDATIASISISATVAAGVGFPLSTTLASISGVHGAHLFGVLAVAAIVVLAARTIPTHHGPRRSVDMCEALLLGLGSTAVLLAVTQGNSWNWTSLEVLVSSTGGLVLLLAWGWRSLRLPAPMIDLRLARTRSVLGAHMTALLAGASMYAVLVVATIAVQASTDTGGLGLDVFVSGLLMLPYSLAGWVGGVLAARSGWPAERILPIGCAWFTVATLTLGVASGSVWGVAVAMAAAGLGGGCAFAALPVVVVNHVPGTATASVLSANHVVRALGFAIGSAMAVVLIELFSPGSAAMSADGVKTAALVMAACGLVGVVVSGLMLRPHPPGSRPHAA
ncbi:MFS transporter [Nocardioides massiliensis]|uniref:MFS family permease n=1 Tax=Nocardioides massiliensis TaxID=1325935 RepID=A0ABT9NK41_9ACTN|nr:MFS transporter [Nocardioides massiliensis]MDP9820758.1 MFS family permease [Nocardioides massiliensis]